MSQPVPFLDLVAQQLEIDDDVQSDLREVFRTAGFIGGPHVASFEEEYAAFVGVPYCVGLGNGTDAVELALRAIGIGTGDEVIAPANTFVATVEAICRAGARPVLVDVDPQTLLIDPELVPAALSPRTKAIVPVHLYGQMAPVELITAIAPGIPIVEDAAQSHGATRHGAVSGSLSVAAATSFYPGKNLGAAGDGGATTTSDPEVARRLRLLGNHGSAKKYVHETLGFNSRLDAVQAVELRHKLRRLPDWNAMRQQAADRYFELLGGLDGITLPVVAEGNEHVWHLYVVQVDERERLASSLEAAGIGFGMHYPVPVHLTDAFADLGYSAGAFPIAEGAAARILSLPMFPHLTVEQQTRVAVTVAGPTRGSTPRPVNRT